jgi:hypothetical protein
VEKAKEHGAKLLALTMDRFLRHPFYNSQTNAIARPTVDQFDSLKRTADGVVLVTLLDPDSSNGEAPSFQIKIGQATKGKKGGRPKAAGPGDKSESAKTINPGDKKRRREAMEGQVLKLRRKGATYNDIVARTGLPRPTIRRWCRSVDA